MARAAIGHETGIARMVGPGHDQPEVGARPSQVGDGFGDQSRLFVRAKSSEDQRGLLLRLGLVSRPVVAAQWDAPDVVRAVALDEETPVAIERDHDCARPEHEPRDKRRADAHLAGAQAEGAEIRERGEFVERDDGSIAEQRRDKRHKQAARRGDRPRTKHRQAEVEPENIGTHGVKRS
jgi:hypothetical protein